MVDFKEEIAKELIDIINKEEFDLNKVKTLVEKPKDKTMGDYAFPCFILSKDMHMAPNQIAEDLGNKLNENKKEESVIEETSSVNGFLNFRIKKEKFVKTICEEYSKKDENFGNSNIGNNKNIVIDYSSPNIAKPFHIGHLRSTVIGGALYNVYKFLEYNVIGVNHLGDYGTQFGKLIEGYKRWGEEYDVESNPIDELTKIYVRINKLCEEDEEVLEECRNNFKKLEDGDSYCKEIWNKFKDLSLKEFQKVYDLLGSTFDSWNGEAFYSDKMQEVIEKLEEKGKIVESEGARIVELGEDIAPCIIGKTNGSTTYATRDLAAILYRARNYDYDKSLYVTSYEQILHFKQVFEVAKYLDLDEKYVKGLKHVPFGMVRLNSGKMSTREGNLIKLEDLLNEAISRALEIIENKNPDLEDKNEVAKKVGVGAVIFNDLSNSRVKDEVFDWDTMLNFNGETGPYVQYICVRTKSVIKKAGYKPSFEEIDFSQLVDEYSLDCLKLLYEFKDVLEDVIDKEEPSILSRYLINLAQSYSAFYNNNQIIVEDKNVEKARLYLTYFVGSVLEKGLNLLGIKVPEQM